MSPKQAIIISVDELVFDLAKIKEKVWKDIASLHNLELSDHFLNTSFDANHDKIERLMREHILHAPHFETVQNRYTALIPSHLENFKINENKYRILKRFSEDFDLYFLTNLNRTQINSLELDKKLDIDVKEVFSTKEVLSGKPDADIFLKIARKLNISATKLIAIDGSLNGVQASYLAKSKGIYVGEQFPVTPLITEYSTGYIDTFEQLEVLVYEWLKDRSE
jgi:beta-phosphoglucomutase-like phosphatase (HAD superfamily)